MTATATASKYITIDQACQMIPGATRDYLAQLRFKGIGPRYYKPTPRKVLYTAADIEAWMENSARTGTASGR